MKMTFDELFERLDSMRKSLECNNVEAVWIDSFALGKAGKKLREAILKNEDSCDYAFPTAKSYLAGWIDIFYAGIDDF